MNTNNLQSQNLNVDIRKNSVSVKCESCEGETFREIVFIRKISKLLTGTTNDSLIPIPTFQCATCGHINEEFTPKFD